MSRLARGLARLAVRTGLAEAPAARVERQRRSSAGWRWPLDDGLLRRLERLALAPRAPAGGGLGGEHRSRARAASTDFVDYRSYAPGDDFRQIDWPAYARLDQLFVRQTEARERSTLYLLLDCSASMDFGTPSKFDVARQLAAAVGYVALTRYDRVLPVRLGGSGPPGRLLEGKQRFGELVRLLDGCRPGGSLDLKTALAEAPRPTRPSPALLISDLLFPAGCAAAFEVLAGLAFEPSVLQVLSPLELRPEAGGDVAFWDVESQEQVPVGLTAEAVARYQGRLTEWCDEAERGCSRRGWRYLRVTTDEALPEVALVGLRRARVLA